MALIRAQAADSARVVVPGRGLLLLLRALLRGAVHRISRAGKSRAVQAADRDDHHPLAGEGRLLVRFPVLQLPPTIRRGFRADDAGQVPARSQMKTQTQSRAGVSPAQRRRRVSIWPYRNPGNWTFLGLRCPTNKRCWFAVSRREN